MVESLYAVSRKATHLTASVAVVAATRARAVTAGLRLERLWPDRSSASKVWGTKQTHLAAVAIVTVPARGGAAAAGLQLGL